jgi:hypothetical protein
MENISLCNEWTNLNKPVRGIILVYSISMQIRTASFNHLNKAIFAPPGMLWLNDLGRKRFCRDVIIL